VLYDRHKDKLKYLQPPIIPKCIFCGAPPPLTGEHVFPKWSHRFLPNTRTKNYGSLRGVRGPNDSHHHAISRPGDIRDWRVSCVCGPTCNNGWMREEIEDRARPILIPLIEGASCRITTADQSRIASWAVLKAMIAEWTIQGHATTSHMQRKRLMRRFLPPEKKWGIWIGHFVCDPRKPAAERYCTLWEAHPFLMTNSQATSRLEKAAHFNCLPARIGSAWPEPRVAVQNSYCDAQKWGWSKGAPGPARAGKRPPPFAPTHISARGWSAYASGFGDVQWSRLNRHTPTYRLPKASRLCLKPHVSILKSCSD
jgi:hypothetical protein